MRTHTSTLASILFAATAARSARAQQMPGRLLRPALASVSTVSNGFNPSRRHERLPQGPHPRVQSPGATDTARHSSWERTDLWAHHTLREYFRVSGPRPWSWAVVGLGTASLSAAVILHGGISHSPFDPNGGGYVYRSDLSLSAGPLGGDCAGVCNLALMAGAQVLTSGFMQLLSPRRGTRSETYARAFVSTQSGLWVLGVMGSL